MQHSAPPGWTLRSPPSMLLSPSHKQRFLDTEAKPFRMTRSVRDRRHDHKWFSFQSNNDSSTPDGLDSRFWPRSDEARSDEIPVDGIHPDTLSLVPCHLQGWSVLIQNIRGKRVNGMTYLECPGMSLQDPAKLGKYSGSLRSERVWSCLRQVL